MDYQFGNSLSSTIDQPEFESTKMHKQQGYQEPSFDKIHKFHGVLLVVSLPLLLITLVLYFMLATSSPESAEDYALTLVLRRLWVSSKIAERSKG